MLKLNKTNLKKLKDNNDTLKDDVIDYVLDEWDNYNDKTAIFTDVLYHGCASGCVGHLIYYSDTIRYYNDHRDEINDLLSEIMRSTGLYNLSELFGDNWEAEDPLATDTHNQNLLAWFGFEETMRNLAYSFEELAEKI